MYDNSDKDHRIHISFVASYTHMYIHTYIHIYALKWNNLFALAIQYSQCMLVNRQAAVYQSVENVNWKKNASMALPVLKKNHSPDRKIL